MSHLFVRLHLYASLFLAFCGTSLAVAQAAKPTERLRAEARLTLPDAPSSLLSLQTSSSASQQQATPAVETPEQRKAREHAEAEAQVKRQEKQRTLGILPNFNTVISGETPALTAGQKFNLVYHTATDPYTFAIAFIVSGVGETQDSHTGYHWGPAGYFKRVGAAYADNVDGALLGNAVLPSLLHQDPRYFRVGGGHPIWYRIVFAAGSTVLCKGDNRKWQFNVSNVAGNFIAGGISNLYYPAEERGAELTINNAAVVTAEGAIGAQLLEFGPDLNAYLARRHQRHLVKLRARQDQQSSATSVGP